MTNLLIIHLKKLLDSVWLRKEYSFHATPGQILNTSANYNGDKFVRWHSRTTENRPSYFEGGRSSPEAFRKWLNLISRFPKIKPKVTRRFSNIALLEVTYLPAMPLEHPLSLIFPPPLSLQEEDWTIKRKNVLNFCLRNINQRLFNVWPSEWLLKQLVKLCLVNV